MVRFRHLAPIATCPRPNVGIARTTRNDKFFVAFLNVTFVRRDCGIGDTNVKFTPRVVRFRHLAPIAPCPRPNVGIARTTRNDKFLVAFLNLTFVRRDCGIGDTNVKFTPRVVRFRHLAPIARCPRPNVGIARTTRNCDFPTKFCRMRRQRLAWLRPCLMDSDNHQSQL